VITQSDYIRYLASMIDEDRGMPIYFRKFMIPQSVLLFLGYSLNDWNFQVIWEGVLASYHATGVKNITHYAVVRKAEDFQRNFWARRNVEIIEYDLTKFAIKLAERFNLEIPQFEIERTGEEKS
ncbi:MAG: SIR2 family protein, partial [Planctomycetota bacterium]